MCSDCQHGVRCVMCSRFRALRNSHQCALLAHYHLYHHDMLERTGTVNHKKEASEESMYTGCLTLQEVWDIEDNIHSV